MLLAGRGPVRWRLLGSRRQYYLAVQSVARSRDLHASASSRRFALRPDLPRGEAELDLPLAARRAGCVSAVHASGREQVSAVRRDTWQVSSACCRVITSWSCAASIPPSLPALVGFASAGVLLSTPQRLADFQLWCKRQCVVVYLRTPELTAICPCLAEPCHALPCHALPRLARPWPSAQCPCLALPRRAWPSLAAPRLASPRLDVPARPRPAVPCLAAPRLAVPRRAGPCRAAPRCPCLAPPCLARPRLAMPCRALPRLDVHALPSRALPRRAEPGPA